MAAFKAGEIDFIADLSADHVDTIRAQNPRAQVMTGKETTPMVAMMRGHRAGRRQAAVEGPRAAPDLQ